MSPGDKAVVKWKRQEGEGSAVLGIPKRSKECVLCIKTQYQWDKTFFWGIWVVCGSWVLTFETDPVPHQEQDTQNQQYWTMAWLTCVGACVKKDCGKGLQGANLIPSAAFVLMLQKNKPCRVYICRWFQSSKHRAGVGVSHSLTTINTRWWFGTFFIFYFLIYLE